MFDYVFLSVRVLLERAHKMMLIVAAQVVKENLYLKVGFLIEIAGVERGSK